MLVGLVGVLIGVVANREPSGTADPAPARLRCRSAN